MFQGIQAVALPMVQEFGYTKEIEDRVLAPLPVWMVALEKVAAGAIQGLIAAAIVFPIAAVVHVKQIHIHLPVHWPVLVTMLPLACITCAALGLTFGTIFDPRQVPLLFGIIILPMTFLGGTYYAWTALAPVKIGELVVAADPRARQPADLHDRGLPRRAHAVAAHAAVRHLPGAGRASAPSSCGWASAGSSGACSAEDDRARRACILRPRGRATGRGSSYAPSGG